MKERALLATLLTAPAMKRSRRWLQATLWSNHSPQNAATNLRQSIARLRRAFANENGLFVTDRLSVRLESSRITCAPRSNRSVMLFEGIDVDDEAFEDWLLDQRQESEANSSVTPGVFAPIKPSVSANQKLRPLITLLRGSGLANPDREVWRLASSLRCRLLELEAVELREAVGPTHDGSGYVLTIERVPPRTSVATLTLAVNSRVLASVRQEGTEEDTDASDAFVERAVESLLTIAEPLCSDEACGNASLTDLNDIFEGLFVPGSRNLPIMMQRIEDAIEVRPSGVQYALRNCVRMLQFGERLPGYTDVTREAVQSDLRVSLLSSPGNAIVHSLAAHAQSLFLADHDAAAKNGLLAVEASPSSAICWGMLALVRLRACDVLGAQTAASRALALSRMSRFRAFFEGISAATSAAAQDYPSARNHAERCLLLAPGFNAVRRIEFLSCERTGAISRALEIARELSKTGDPFGRAVIEGGDAPVNIATLRNSLVESTVRLGLL